VACVEADLLQPPFPDRSFDLVVAVRMLAHIQDTQQFIAGLCRVARYAVIVDYPDVRSLNAITPLLYGLKKMIEGSTRTYRLYRRRELINLFARQGFADPHAVGQFFWPMVLHRMIGRPALSRRLEAIPAVLNLSQLLGSPIILRVVRT
jgi:2-polyprenyl-3-methyl-5-hydroxy-6-metoxy-1,4-benzoquinol methylase